MRSWLLMIVHPASFSCQVHTMFCVQGLPEKETGTPAASAKRSHDHHPILHYMQGRGSVFSSSATEPHQLDDQFSQPQWPFQELSFALQFRLRHGAVHLGSTCSTLCKTCMCGSALRASPVVLGVLRVYQSLLRARKHCKPFKSSSSYSDVREVRMALRCGGSIARLGPFFPNPSKAWEHERPPTQGFMGFNPLKRPD
jgi:hypothetical protein